MNDNGFPQGAVLVFGGSGGIGQGVALEFARAGVPVAVGYRSKADVAERVARDIRGEGVAATTHCVDVTDSAQVDAALAAASGAHGRVHTVVWAAGPFVNQRHIGDMTHDDWRRAIDVETIGFFVAAKAALPHFRASGGGSFVTLGSAGHLRWPERDGLSVAPKAANEALVKGLAREEGRYDIRANSILVGVIEAGMFPVLLEQGQFDQAWIDETQKMLALKRWGKAHDVGRAAVFLASDRAGYITGQQLNVSGGVWGVAARRSGKFIRTTVSERSVVLRADIARHPFRKSSTTRADIPIGSRIASVPGSDRWMRTHRYSPCLVTHDRASASRAPGQRSHFCNAFPTYSSAHD
ncbi:SDR family NAD(P)-dependent oxidoreductase [Burkholderia cepacia]|uniref:SDR family NAD(P)-dependent oxidoreductase n=1 Tax=Burkholderia cepacia TaxID=292 RepID=UPI0021AB6F50|nr:SDR family oxidoreductase [Burkholderia cepacia]